MKLDLAKLCDSSRNCRGGLRSDCRYQNSLVDASDEMSASHIEILCVHNEYWRCYLEKTYYEMTRHVVVKVYVYFCPMRKQQVQNPCLVTVQLGKEMGLTESNW